VPELTELSELRLKPRGKRVDARSCLRRELEQMRRGMTLGVGARLKVQERPDAASVVRAHGRRDRWRVRVARSQQTPGDGVQQSSKQTAAAKAWRVHQATQDVGLHR
jgi:hypothetical protein